MRTCLILATLLPFFNSSTAQQSSAELKEGMVKTNALISGGTRHVITLEKDGCATVLIRPQNADILVRVLDPAQRMVAEYAERYTNRAFPISLDADTSGPFYVTVLPYSKNVKDGKYSIKLLSRNSSSQCTSVKKQRASNDATIVSWLKQNAIPISSVNEEKDFSDLQPLKKILQNVTVIDLGEQTHGTSEFFEFKSRMVKFLATQMDYTVFAMEEAFTVGLALNQYILNGVGNLDTLFPSMIQVWNTQEVRNMIEWMRQYNKTVSAEKKLKFYGFDVLDRHVVDSVEDYFQKFAPAEYQKVKGYLADFFTANDSVFLTNTPKYQWIKTYLLTNKKNLIAKSGKENFDHVIVETNIFFEQLEMARAGTLGFFKRDEGMAKNILSICHNQKPGSRIILWAHNGHINAADPMMGKILKDTLRDKYYPVNFIMNKGSFRAQRSNVSALFIPTTDSTGYTSFSVPDAPSNFIEHYFAATAIPMFMLDLRFSRMPGPVEKWINRWSTTRTVGRVYSEDDVPWFHSEGILLKHDFDGVFFINNSSAAHNRLNQ